MLKSSRGFTLIELIVCIVIVLIIGGLIGGGCYKMFSRKEYTGTVQSIAELNNLTMVQTTRSNSNRMVYSFAIDLMSEGEIISFSSEDRKFATVKKGDEIKVSTCKYAPWNFDKAGTLYNGRLLKKLKVAE